MRGGGLADEGEPKPYKKRPPKTSSRPPSTAGSRAAGHRRRGRRGRHDDPVAGAGKAQDLDGEFFDDVGIPGVEKPHVALEAGARRLEAGEPPLQTPGSLGPPGA